MCLDEAGPREVAMIWAETARIFISSAILRLLRRPSPDMVNASIARMA